VAAPLGCPPPPPPLRWLRPDTAPNSERWVGRLGAPYSPKLVEGVFSEVAWGLAHPPGLLLCRRFPTHPKRLNHRPHTPNEHEDPQDKR
jgi:hypothetical protein